MSRHRALLVTVGTIFVALSCCSTFAQPASPQKQGASPSQYTVNVSKGTIIAPPVNSARPPLPPDVRACLDRVAQDLLGGVAEVRRNESADAFGKVVTAFDFGQETGKSIVAFDPLHFEWASVDFAAAKISGVGSAYGLASDLVEAKVRWDLYQQGVSSVEERDRQFVAGKDQAMQQVNELLADNSPLLGSADPMSVMNSAVNQALNITTGRSLILVDPVDDLVASQQSQQALQSALDSGVNTATSGGLIGADETGQFVSSGQAGQVVESASGAGLNTATAGGLTGTNAVGQLASSAQELNADDEVQISNELVDNELPSSVTISSPSIVDGGPLVRPQAASSSSSGGFWNLQNLVQIGVFTLQAIQAYEGAAHPAGGRAPVSSHTQKARPSTTKPINSICGQGYYVNPNFLAGLPWVAGQSVCVANGTTQPYTLQSVRATQPVNAQAQWLQAGCAAAPDLKGSASGSGSGVDSSGTVPSMAQQIAAVAAFLASFNNGTGCVNGSAK